MIGSNLELEILDKLDSFLEVFVVAEGAMSFLGFFEELRESFAGGHVVAFYVVYLGNLVHFGVIFNNTIIIYYRKHKIRKIIRLRVK